VEGDVVRRAVAEFVGTFALIFVGAGAIMTAAGPADQSPLLAAALAHGLVIGVFASAVGHISGAHFNPAVTFAFLVTRRMAPSLAIVYWVTQFAAAVVGAVLLRWIYPAELRDGLALGAPFLEGVSGAEGFVIEAILTFFLVWVIFACAADPRGTFKSIAGLAIGFTISLDVLMGGPLTGAAMNPARAFGPELVSAIGGGPTQWAQLVPVYILPGLAGAGLAAAVYDALATPRRISAPIKTAVTHPDPADVAAVK
jgi:MIP family channel proteins